MDEKITEERKQNLIKYFTKVAEEDMLTNSDALEIIDILQKACERKQIEIYEDYVSSAINGSEEEC